MLTDLEQEVHEFKLKLHFSEQKSEKLIQELFSLRKELASSRKEYDDLYDFTPLPFITMNQNHIIQSVNFQAATFLQTDRKSLLNKLFLNYISSKSEVLFQNNIQLLFKNKFKQIFEVELVQKKGNTRQTTVQCCLLKNNDFYQINLIDNSAIRNLIAYNNNLQKSFNLINYLFKSSSDAISTLDDKLNLIMINESFTEIISKLIAVKVTVGMNLVKILNEFPELKSQILDASQKALEGTPTQFIIENPIKTATLYYYYEFSINSIFNHKNKKNELIFRIRNVTHFKLKERIQHKQQSELAISSRLSTRVEMVSALAHEINQPLTAITAYSNACLFLMENEEKNDELNQKLFESIKKISTQAELAGEIIHNMKNIGNEGKSHFEETDINQLINDTLSILHYEVLDFQLKIQLNLMKNLPHVMTNKIQIMQVILNLAHNSIEALQSACEEKPEITIETYLYNDFLYINIKDNGPGIPKEFRNLILNTYFTTKRKGTGIGLGICRTLIEAHGGKLSIQPSETKGACFIFTLPVNSSSKRHHENS